jgi:hypothetical protein
VDLVSKAQRSATIADASPKVFGFADVKHAAIGIAIK